jgi:hypothetical protein
MRFSIRDLVWVTVVVAMGLGWWVSYRALNAKRLEAVGQVQRHRETLSHVKLTTDAWHEQFKMHGINILPLLVDWSILDDPLVEP